MLSLRNADTMSIVKQGTESTCLRSGVCSVIARCFYSSLLHSNLSCEKEDRLGTDVAVCSQAVTVMILIVQSDALSYMGYWTSLTEGSSWSRACFKSKQTQIHSNFKLLMMQNASAKPFLCLTDCSIIGAKEHISELRIFSKNPYHSISIKIDQVAKFSISSAFNCHGKKQGEKQSFCLALVVHFRTSEISKQQNTFVYLTKQPHAPALIIAFNEFQPGWSSTDRTAFGELVDWPHRHIPVHPVTYSHCSSVILIPKYRVQCQLHIKFFPLR